MTSGQFRTLAMFFGKVWKIVDESENNENSLFSTVVAYRWTWTFSGKTFIRWVFFFTKLGTSCDPFNWKALNKSCNSSALYTVQSDFFITAQKQQKLYLLDCRGNYWWTWTFSGRTFIGWVAFSFQKLATKEETSFLGRNSVAKFSQSLTKLDCKTFWLEEAMKTLKNVVYWKGVQYQYLKGWTIKRFHHLH